MANKAVLGALAVMICALVAVGIGLSVYYGVDWDDDEFGSVPYSDLAGIERFDCYPEAGGSQQACEERACVWSETDVEGAPWCYYHPNGDYGYVMVSIKSPFFGFVEPHFLVCNHLCKYVCMWFSYRPAGKEHGTRSLFYFFFFKRERDI